MERFTINENNFCHFYLGLFTKSPLLTGNLKNVVIKIPVLSQGNACVELGFSIYRY